MPTAANQSAITHTHLRRAIHRMRVPPADDSLALSATSDHSVFCDREPMAAGHGPHRHKPQSFPSCRVKTTTAGLAPGGRGGTRGRRSLSRRHPSLAIFFIHVNGRSVSTGLVEIFSPRMFSKMVP